MFSLLSILLIAYLCGSLPFGYLIARIVIRDDIRNHGSGNIGATNVRRVLGNKWGILVLFLDALKGALPVLLVPPLFFTRDDPFFLNAHVLAGIMAVVGHMFPVWLRFKGGKGVATALGVVLVLNWQASVAALVVFVLTVAITRIVSLGSMLGAVSFAIAHFVFCGQSVFSTEQIGLTVFSVAVPTLILVRHRANIGRIFRGEEARLGRSSTQSSPEDSATADSEVNREN